MNHNIEDIAAMRAQGDLKDYLLSLVGTAPATPKPTLAAVPSPGYRIAHTGGWPLGTAATGPTPSADQCTCAKCGGNPNTATHREEAA
ncbi:hypothetical protein [Streptomyces canus]|uniref:hypothetical protein n=1 Tax=Streptomyces canus TaxID=58343 RepID=UPI00278AAC65|nr:hypothetical protein [Streptomyces canus]MDQ0758746.1 hypothetical protein [Streptomyces canus]